MNESPQPDLADKLVGVWESEARTTRQRGPMGFTFAFMPSGELRATAMPVPGSGAQPLHRAGPYRLRGAELQSDAINEGQPVLIRLESGELQLRFDAELSFQLRRK